MTNFTHYLLSSNSMIAVKLLFDMLEFSFRFIVRTCDMKTCEEQGEQDRKTKQQKNQETMRHYRQQHQQRCMHAS
jgi:hypothetical protein